MMDPIEQYKLIITQKDSTVPEKIEAHLALAKLLFDSDIQQSLTYALEASILAKAIGDKEAEAESAYWLGIIYSKLRNFEEAIQQFEWAKNICPIENATLLGNILHKLGTAYLQSGNHTKAIEVYLEAREIKLKLQEEIAIAEIDTNSGAIFQFKGSYPLALKNYYAALKTFEKENLEAKIASIYNNIGIIYFEQKNYDEAMKNFQKALLIRQKQGEKSAEASVLTNIGNICKDKHDFVQALHFYQQALEIKTNIGDSLGIANNLNNIGNLYSIEKKFDQAISFLERSLEIRKQSLDNKGIVESYINLGEVYFEMKDYNQSLSLINQALHIALENDFKYLLQDIYHLLSKIYAAEIHFQEAYSFLGKYIVVNQEILNLETSHQLAQMNSRNEIEQKERETTLEKNKNKELQIAYASLEKEKERSEELLHNILPIEVADELKNFGKSNAKHYDQVTVLFADIKGFTQLTEILSPQLLIDTIDSCYRKFDDIIEQYNVEKIKVIGDCYMCAGGIPIENITNATDVVLTGLAFLDALEDLNTQFKSHNIPPINFRIGIHTGSLITGIVGRKKFTYDIWGDTVNVAARMEQSGEPGKVNISQSTYDLVKNQFHCTFRGKIDAKNKGKINMYFVENKL